MYRVPEFCSMLWASKAQRRPGLLGSNTSGVGIRHIANGAPILSESHYCFNNMQPGRVAQSVGHLTHKSGVLGSIPGLATYFRFSFRFFKKASCQLLAKVCARSTG